MAYFSRLSSIILVVSTICVGLLLGGIAGLGTTLKPALDALHAANASLKQQSDEKLP